MEIIVSTMRLYNKYVLPRIIDFACSRACFIEQRKSIIPEASGNILEIGIGSGLNLPFYDMKKVKHITGIEPSNELMELTLKKTKNLGIKLDLLANSVEKIDIDSSSIDSVVLTFTMCSIHDIESALNEIRRVLKPTGSLLFCEHGLAPLKHVQKIQNLVTPMWKKISGGCHLNRNIERISKDNGFNFKRITTSFITGWRPISYIYKGAAVLN